MTMHIVYLQFHDGHEIGEDYYTERSLARRLCDEGKAIPYSIYQKQQAEIKASAKKDAEEKAAAKKAIKQEEKEEKEEKLKRKYKKTEKAVLIEK